jgi:hypothetical protein
VTRGGETVDHELRVLATKGARREGREGGGLGGMGGGELVGEVAAEEVWGGKGRGRAEEEAAEGGGGGTDGGGDVGGGRIAMIPVWRCQGPVTNSAAGGGGAAAERRGGLLGNVCMRRPCFGLRNGRAV